MTAYRRVYDSRHVQADCQGPGSAPEPYVRQSSTGQLYVVQRVMCGAKVAWKRWTQDVSELRISADAKFADIIVPTMDTIRCTFIIELLLCCQRTVASVPYSTLVPPAQRRRVGRTGPHLLAPANGRKLFFFNLRKNSDCNFIRVCVQQKQSITAAAPSCPQYPGARFTKYFTIYRKIILSLS